MGRKTTTIPKASVARILEKAGAKRISDDGAAAFSEAITEIGLKIARKANEISKHAKRKTIHEEDIKLAAR